MEGMTAHTIANTVDPGELAAVRAQLHWYLEQLELSPTQAVALSGAALNDALAQRPDDLLSAAMEALDARLEQLGEWESPVPPLARSTMVPERVARKSWRERLGAKQRPSQVWILPLSARELLLAAAAIPLLSLLVVRLA